jgi:hypothetical protein
MPEMLDVLLGEPASSIERTILLILGGLTILIALVRVMTATGIPNVGRYHPLVVAAVGFGGIVAGMTAVRLYVLPGWGTDYDHILLIAGGLVASTVVTLALMCLLQRASVMAALGSWTVSVFFALLVVVVAGVVFEAMGTGKANLKTTKSRSVAIEKFLKDH